MPNAAPVLRRTLAVLAVAVTVLATMLAAAGDASAARSFKRAESFSCSNALVRVFPPRVWASGNRPEYVVWGIQLERYDGSRWVVYSKNFANTMFDYYGRSATSWGIRFVNSRLNVPVRHRGYYRVSSAVAAAGVNDVHYIGGPGTYCYMP